MLSLRSKKERTLLYIYFDKMESEANLQPICNNRVVSLIYPNSPVKRSQYSTLAVIMPKLACLHAEDIEHKTEDYFK